MQQPETAEPEDGISLESGSPSLSEPAKLDIEVADAHSAVEPMSDGPFHIIVGCFGIAENAYTLNLRLKEQGYPSRNIGLNKAGLTMISASSHASLPEAEAALSGVRRFSV